MGVHLLCTSEIIRFRLGLIVEVASICDEHSVSCLWLLGAIAWLQDLPGVAHVFCGVAIGREGRDSSR